MSKTHEFTRTWGDNYTFTPLNDGQAGRVSGWKAGIQEKDYLILQNGNATTRYQVESVKYYDDPRDMFAAQVKFAPRT